MLLLKKQIEALAQTMGYRWKFPKGVAHRKVQVRMTAPLDEILGELSRQARVEAVFDHQARMIRVFQGPIVPRLPVKN